MTDEGPQHVLKSRGENATGAVLAGTLPPVRPVRLEAELRGTATLNFEAMTLTGCTVTAGRSLDSASLRRIGRTMAEAYTDLALRTQAAGLWFQPVVAFYRIRATDGSTLYTSPPKILCAPSGWQGCAGIATPCTISGEAADHTVSIPAFQTTVDTFRIKATVPPDLLPGEWMKRVVGVEICVSPQIHPFDAADKAACSITAWHGLHHHHHSAAGSHLAPGIARKPPHGHGTQRCREMCGNVRRSVARGRGRPFRHRAPPHRLSRRHAIRGKHGHKSLHGQSPGRGFIGRLRKLTAPDFGAAFLFGSERGN